MMPLTEQQLDEKHVVFSRTLLSGAGPRRATREAWLAAQSFEQFQQFKHIGRGDVERVTTQWRELGLGWLGYGDVMYPSGLVNSSDPPLLLYTLGDWRPEYWDRPQVAIVGSRNGDRVGCDVAFELAREIANAGGCVVSGLAMGIDTAAHKGAIASGQPGATVAVLGNGLPGIYPRSNERLAREIVEQGSIILSQFPPQTPPYPSQFLERNYTIAAIAQAVVVVQANKRSGALATARYALEEGREVCAVPGSVRDPRSEGTNELLKHGATLVRNIDDLLEHVAGLARAKQAQLQQPTHNPLQSQIVTLLKRDGVMSEEQLRSQLQNTPDIETQLLELELSGQLKRLPGNMLGLGE